MNFSEVLTALNQASAFELYRMRAAIERALDEPSRTQAVQSRLQLGQMIDYFDVRSNALRPGAVLELRRKTAVIRDIGDGRRWQIDYASINLDGADVQIREHVRQGLGRNELAVGDTVGFLDREQRQRSGRVIRLNDKSVTLLCDQVQWRVAYDFLHRVLDVEASGQLELEVLSVTKT